MSRLTENYFPFYTEYLNEIIIGVIIVILTGLLYYFKDSIKKRLFLRKVGKIFDPLIKNYYEKIMTEDEQEKPILVALTGEVDISSKEEIPFGYIFVPMENEELIKPILISNIPISSSFKTVRILFDESLRKNLFRFLSYRLALESDETELASRIRDLSLRQESQSKDFEIIEKIYNEGKLNGIVLNEAKIRLKQTNNIPTISDVKEFSRFVRKTSEFDVKLIRIGRLANSSAYASIESCKTEKKGIVLLARGENVEKAIKISEDLNGIDTKMGISYIQYPSEELGFNNPETGTWYFKGNEVPFIRIWLKTVLWRQVGHAWIRADHVSQIDDESVNV